MNTKDIGKKISANIKTLMNESNLSNADLARKSGLPTGTISKILNENINLTLMTLLKLSTGLNVAITDILDGVIDKSAKKLLAAAKSVSPTASFFIGILSLDNKRMTCIKNAANEVIGTSELNEGLDLAETIPSVLGLMQNSIDLALNKAYEAVNLKEACLAIVVQSYEFIDTRKKFENFAEKQFSSVTLFPDWQISYLAAFNEGPGISVVIDKGVSCSYMHDGQLKKLGGWKFPVYDLGGENWLGLMAIHHTIEAYEGYIAMTQLARDVLAKFEGQIEKITETCFKGGKDPDVYCQFSDILLRSYLEGDDAAKNIIEEGFRLIYRAVERIDRIVKKKNKIIINGSLANIYIDFFPKNRVIPSPDEAKKVQLLADLAKKAELTNSSD